ncbi:hybrid-cluster NAD(P)-dependent oxidoreductase [Sansalvadorimonas verongulae]|uniref:hybrid-cluster NAD(P)-dependent oxidoreductase n=1 Tax=Sansalvadorimonas verongulae TaxID=2172824 RepID=UPI0012BC8FE6|nr:hybrid-cluster NAD(P)-dependent oxidoreductase [Sansalvadorimonas verongulae]MTI15064.1 hybrid-cluster NAD(P)-dependent oxidoreductase [Sansalvadorimonas verongulae]
MNSESNNEALNWAQAPVWEKGSVELICQQVIRETADISTFVFQTEQKTRFQFKPGQFITLIQEIDGEKVYRSYSMSSTPSRPYTLNLTIQRVEGGKMSNWLFENLKPGSRIQATGPDGVFNIVDIPAKKVLFISASSGITPVMSMSRWLLDTCADADIRFLHCAASESGVVFRRELELLDAQHDNFNLSTVLDDRDGLLNQEMLQQLVPDLHSRDLFICGSPGYINAVREMVESAGFNMDQFHQEFFNADTIKEIEERTEGATDAEVAEGFEVKLEKTGAAVTVDPSELLVDVLQGQGAPVIAACRAGVCGACKVQILDGEVDSSSQMTLTPEEIEQGYVLSCSCRAKSDLSVNI